MIGDRIGKIKKEWELPVIILTALGDEASVATGFDQGADDYIAKPFHPLELISRVKNVLRRSGKSQSVYRIATILDKGEYDYTLENRKSEEAYNTMPESD